jgi:hypothetical protein
MTENEILPYLYEPKNRLVITDYEYTFSCCPILKPIVWVAGFDCDVRGELVIWKCGGCEEMFSIQHSPECSKNACTCLFDKIKCRVIQSKYMR